MDLQRIYFEKWKELVLFRRYDRWSQEFLNEIKNEELDEINYAVENDMDSIYWCWNCKYSDCYIHN